MTVAWNHVETTVCRLLGFIHIGLAAAVLVGGAKRFPTPNYDSILNLSGGRAWPYAVLWLIGGVAMLMRSTLCRIIGTAAAGFISSLWAGLFSIAALNSSTAALTPIAAYGGYALLNSVMFWVMAMRLIERRHNHEAR